MKETGWLLLFILTIGAVLRFYGFPHIPFMYDELSAWGRTGYSSFSELINQGVSGDGHPALIQVFLQYWRKIFGDSEAVFKLPFLLMGMSCIWLMFVVGKLWFNQTVGVLSSAFVAVLQYTIIHSQIARPYISGLFFSLLMVYCWTKYVFNQQQNSGNKYLTGFVVFAALCCYNHYFSLLFAVIVGASGYFILNRSKWLEYSFAGGVVALLFAPHLGVTRDQFSIGGVGGWLAKPDSNFFTHYLDYIFHFSWRMKGLVLILIVASLFFINPEWRKQNRFRLLCAAWFLLPILIGYIYSKYRNPVLQYSVLIFSFPFFLMLVFSFFKELKFLHQTLIVILILGVGSYSLIAERKHYEIFYMQPVEQLVKQSVEFSNQHQDKKTLIIISEPLKYMGYYLKEWNEDVKIISWQDLNFDSYIRTKKFILQERPDYVICGNIPVDHLLVIRQFYPKIISVDKGFTYDWFALGKSTGTEQEINEVTFLDSLNFTQPGRNWNALQKHVFTDTSGNHFFQVDSSIEYSGGYVRSLREIMKHEIDWFLVDVAVDEVPPNSTASLVISFGSDQQPFLWQEKPFSLFIDSNEISGHLVYALRFRDFDFMKKEKPPVKVYVWNRNHESFRITSIKVTVEKGNPWVYSLIEPIPHYADEYRQ